LTVEPSPVAFVGIGVTVAIFLLGVTYQCGRLSARVESLEQWRARMDTALDNVHNGLRSIEQLIKGEG
jgi:hypothetical protein